MGKKIPQKIKTNPRFVAMELLTKVASQQAYSNLLVNDAISKAELSERDGRLMTEIMYGTISRKLTLEYFVHPFIKKAKKVEDWVYQLLLLSLYQLLYLDRVPAHGIVNDAVEIAKSKGNEGTGKFVNGVLRSIQRQGVRKIEDITDPRERLSVELSMPLWLVDKFVADIGEEETRKLGLSLFAPSKVSARVNTALISREEAIEFIKGEGIEVEESPISPYGIVGKSGFLAGSQLYREGKITIQDESSMLVAPSMAIEPHHHVLDACAAPGGKTTHMATFVDEKQGGKIIALDIHEHKTKLIEENAERLHVEERIETRLMDARKIALFMPSEQFDRISVDAPCSGLGLLRRKPDIKYSKKPEDFVKLPEIQLAILESVAKNLKQYGIITYSTCTTTNEENIQVIERFLERNPEFELIDVPIGENLKNFVHEKYVTIYPHQYGTDGFFISCLKRNV